MTAKSKAPAKKTKVAQAPSKPKTMTAKEVKDYASDMESVEYAKAYAEPSFQYKIPKTRKLHPDERTWSFLQNISAFKGKKTEAAALLGVTPAALTLFFQRYPQAVEAWERGRALRKFQIRKLLMATAENDAPTLRFLAKNELGMSDGPSTQTKLDVTINQTPESERLAKLEALQSKVIDHVPSTPTSVEDAVIIEETPRAIDALIERSKK